MFDRGWARSHRAQPSASVKASAVDSVPVCVSVNSLVTLSPVPRASATPVADTGLRPLVLIAQTALKPARQPPGVPSGSAGGRPPGILRYEYSTNGPRIVQTPGAALWTTLTSNKAANIGAFRRKQWIDHSYNFPDLRPGTACLQPALRARRAVAGSFSQAVASWDSDSDAGWHRCYASQPPRCVCSRSPRA